MYASAPMIARLLLESGAVVLRPEQPFRFSSGLLSPIYCDNRLLFSQVSGRQTVTTAMEELIAAEALTVEVLAGTATSGIPWASWLAERLALPMVYVRGSAKSYGRGQRIEGGPVAERRALVIEDLVSTGGSALQAVDGLRESGALVAECVAIFSYAMEAATANFASAGVRLLTLTTFPVLLDVAASEGYIQSDQRELVAAWGADPQAWAARAGIDAEGAV